MRLIRKCGPSRFCVGIALLGCLAVSCARVKRPLPGSGDLDAVTICLPSAPAAYSPVAAATPEDKELSGALFRPLWDWDESWDPVPVLLSGLPASPGFAARFQLKPNLRWSNGDPITSDDVLLSYELLTDPASGVPDTAAVFRISSIAITDLRSFSVRWNSLGMQPTPGFRKIMKIRPQDFHDPEFFSSPRFQSPSAVNGPYVPISVTRDDAILKANPMAADKPRISRAIFKWYPNPGRFRRALETGECDVYPILRPTDSIPSGFRKSVLQSTKLYVLSFNLNNPFLKNSFARQGLMWSLPRPELARETGDFAVPQSFLPKHARFYLPVLKGVKRDLLKADWFLAKAGWRRDHPHELLRDPRGQSLILACGFQREDPVAQKLFQTIKESWGKTGVVVLEGTAGEVSGAWIHVLDVRPDEKPSDLFGKTGGSRLMGGMSRALEGGRSRKTAFSRLQKSFADEIPFVPLGFVPEISAFREALEGVKPRGIGPLTWNMEEWAWRGPNQR